MKARLQKLIADSGLCSRRKAESLISRGRVSVNGRQAELGESADPLKDMIVVDGTPLSPEEKAYFVLNKPPGYECTLRSTTGKPLATDLVAWNSRLFPVGRLDLDSRGLLILTNDGDFANRVIHPRSSPDKEYLVRVKEEVSDAAVERLGSGIMLDRRPTRPCAVKVVERNTSSTVLSFTIHEGRKRQIRRMLDSVGYAVADLKRVRIGCITLDGLKEGHSRRLTGEEVACLMSPGGAEK